MSKLIPRKIKKACKSITLVYRECELVGFQTKKRRNTKWTRKAVLCAIKEQRKLYENVDKIISELIEEKTKDYDNRH